MAMTQADLELIRRRESPNEIQKMRRLLMEYAAYPRIPDELTRLGYGIDNNGDIIVIDPMRPIP